MSAAFEVGAFFGGQVRDVLDLEWQDDMKKQARAIENSKPQAIAQRMPEDGSGLTGIEDPRPEALAQQQLQAKMDRSPQVQTLQAAQLRADHKTRKSPSAPPVQMMRGSTPPSMISTTAPVAQLVKNEQLRLETDVEMDSLKERTKLILAQLQRKGGDWKIKYGKMAREKVEQKVKDKIAGKKGDSMESMVAKKIWEQLTFEEKAQVVSTVVKTTGKGIFRGIQEAMLLSDGRDEPRREEPKPKKKDEPKQEGSGILGSALSLLGEASKEDLEAMYDVMKEYRAIKGKVDKEVEEAVKEIGKVGQGVGEFVGEIRDEHEFENLIKEFKSEYIGAKDQFIALESKIQGNSDEERYQAELDALHNALRYFGGIHLAMWNDGNMGPKYRVEFPDLCATNLQDLNESSRSLGLIETVTGLPKATKEASKVVTAQERTASALKRVVHQSWSKVTKWKSVPNGVSALRALSRGMDAKPYLEAAKATNFGAPGSNRNDLTKSLYGAVKGLNTDSEENLNTATATITKVGTDLLLKK